MHEIGKEPVAQGEVTIRRIDALPDGMTATRVERASCGYVISHSENGNHHVLTDGEVMERTDGVPAGMRIFYAIVENPAEFRQDGPDPHEAYRLPPAIYEFRISREYNPFADEARQVAD